MVSHAAATQTALKFISGINFNICRLCFASTENEEIPLHHSERLKRAYFDDNVTFNDMLLELEVPTEPLLPQGLCLECGNTVMNSYLFKKLCQYSNEKWTQALDRLAECLTDTDSLNPKNVKTAYLMLSEKNNYMVTSKSCSKGVNKTSIVNKISKILARGETKQNVVNQKQSIVCEECGDHCESKLQLAKHKKMHIKNSLDRKFSCSECGKCFHSRHCLTEHEERMHYQKNIKCPKCPKMFSTARILKQHEKTNHVAVICKECFIQFPSRIALRAHLIKHKVYKCPKCNRSLVNKHTYEQHLKICGKPKQTQPNYFCDICGRGYATKGSLRSHLKMNHNFGRLLTCNWCNKKFDAKSRLMNHIVKHTRERNFYCEHCGGRFVSHAALVYHIRLHTGEKPFPCDLCDESFLSASRRMEHKKRKHIGPTKECPVCDMKFVMGFELRKHVRRHYNPQSKLYMPSLMGDPSFVKTEG